ncbi:PadR family transcriptional regulator [Cupriavidus pauculus]|uniref:PadR family transcriptional regulator n=1 Tax=Cupriavidus pauculus TaxID=82633 RepID=A0A3G8H9V5_9BURK|nr:PadR family transcriptional regulator [Cupriavidus pauculus]AZG17196.1 PadR family transcriptional regulator [Cupriavidus pauculus]
MKMSQSGLLVLKVFLEHASAPIYGYTLMQAAGISSGTLYPLLARFEAEGLLTSAWETSDPAKAGRPRRRLYRMTAHGTRVATEVLSQLRGGVLV